MRKRVGTIRLAKYCSAALFVAFFALIGNDCNLVVALESAPASATSDDEKPQSTPEAVSPDNEIRLKGRTGSVALRIDARIHPMKQNEPLRYDSILNHANLGAIKNFILKQGKTQTYCQMFNDNPFWEIKPYQFYLNPDPGPFNVDCDPLKSDFHTLVIRDWNANPRYLHVDFQDENNVVIKANWPSDDLGVGLIREKAETAIKVFLNEMRRVEGDSSETFQLEDSVENERLKGRIVVVTLGVSTVVLPIKKDEPRQYDSILNHANLNAIKSFILKQGKTLTYCQRFNDNPFWHTNSYQFYLNSDSDLFTDDCDPEKSDFHTLVIRNMDWGLNQYRYVLFSDELDADMTIEANWPTDDLDVGQIRDKAEEAIEVILNDIRHFEGNRP